MRRSKFPFPGRVRAGLRLLALLLLAQPGPAQAFINYSWLSAVSGSAGDATRWNPNGLPGVTDNLRFELAGSYAVAFPASVPLSTMLICGAGNVTFNMDSPHTTHELLVGATSGIPSLTFGSGATNTDYVNVGYPGSQSWLTLTGASVLHSKSMANRYYGGLAGDVIGHGGIGNLDMRDGAQYYCDITELGSHGLQVGTQPGAVGNVYVAGGNGTTVPYTGLHVTGSTVGEGLIAGFQGVANMFISNGGYADVVGRTIVAQLQGSSGYVTVGPAPASAPSHLDVQEDLWIGSNHYSEVLGGHGELTIRDNGFVRVGGRCRVGDSDNDASSVLRVEQGGLFRTNGGLRVYPVSGPGLDLRGGLTHVRGGAFEWPANKYLSVSSTVGTPTLAISSGVTSTGPNTGLSISQLFVGRDGSGALRVTQPGTVFTMGSGGTLVGESQTGVGLVVADSAAAIVATGPFYVGVSGTAEMDVLGGSSVDMGNLAAGLASSAEGIVVVSGAGSIIRAKDRVYVGGGDFGVGGTGRLQVEDGGTVSVAQGATVNPPVVTVYPGTGSITVAAGGALTTPGTVDTRGNITVLDGQISAQTISLWASGNVNGHGVLNARMIVSGTIEPYSEGSPVGTFQINGNVQQYGASHYLADIGQPNNPRGDLLEINGAVALDGTLDLRTPPGFVGDPGDVFTILTCTSLTGVYGAVTWNGSPLAGQANVVYGSNAVWVVIPGVPTGVEPGSGSAGASQLSFAPLRGETRLGFALGLPAAADVQVKVYDVRGREAAALFSGSLGAGRHEMQIPAGDADRLASGVYFARAVVQSGGQTSVRVARTIIVR